MHYFLEGSEYSWDLVRETVSSQKFFVTIGGPMELKATCDIHYTKPTIAYVSICLIGKEDYFTDGVTHQLFQDLDNLISKHGSYRAIDYSLINGDRVFNGNYTMNDIIPI